MECKESDKVRVPPELMVSQKTASKNSNMAQLNPTTIAKEKDEIIKKMRRTGSSIAAAEGRLKQINHFLKLRLPDQKREKWERVKKYEMELIARYEEKMKTLKAKLNELAE